MARRRVKANTFKGEQNFNTPRFLSEFDGLGDLANLAGDEELPDVSGTSNREMVEDVVEFPRTPNDPRLYDDVDDPGVDDVPGIPEGIELLGDLAGTEAREDALDEFTETEPPSYPQEETQAGFPWGSMFGLAGLAAEPVKEYFSPEKRQQLSDENQKAFDRNQQRIQGVPEEVVQEETVVEEPKPLPPAVQKVNEGERKPMEEISEADFPENADEMAPVEGAIETAREIPEYRSVISRFMGVNEGELKPGVFDLAEKMQNSLTKERNSLDAEEQAILQKMQTGQMSTGEKIALGIALATPIILGLAFGGGAFAAGAGALVSGVSGYLEDIGKQGAKGKERLGKIEESRTKLLDKEKALVDYVNSNLENPELRRYLKNNDLFDIQKNEDGTETVVPGKDIGIFGDKVGIKSPTESGEALYYDANQLRDDESVKDLKEAMKKGNEEYQAAKNSDRVVSETVELMKILKSQDPTIFSKLAQYVQPSENGLLNLVYPESWKSLMIDVQDENGNLTKVRAMPLLQQYITALQDPYNKEYLGGTRLTEGVREHWREVFPNPTAIKSWLSSDFDTMLAQAKNFRSILNQRVTDNLVGMGFLREPLKQTLPISTVNFRNTPFIDAKAKKQIMSEDREKYKKREK